MRHRLATIIALIVGAFLLLMALVFALLRSA